MAELLQLGAVVDGVYVELYRKRCDEPRPDPREAAPEERSQLSQIVKEDPREDAQAQCERETGPCGGAISDVPGRLERGEEEGEY